MKHHKFHQKRKKQQNFHHILFPKRNYQTGYAKLLRQHPYMGKYLQSDQLHIEIHRHIQDMPAPSRKECRRAYEMLELLRSKGMIDCQNDTIEQRIDTLIEIWKFTCPATVHVLEYQRQIAAQYYQQLHRQPASF